MAGRWGVSGIDGFSGPVGAGLTVAYYRTPVYETDRGLDWAG